MSKSEHKRSVVLLLTVLLIGIILNGSAPLALPYVPRAHAVTRTMSLVGFAFTGWNGSTPSPNPTITVIQGDAITLSLSSGDGAPHRFVVDVDRDGKIFTPICPPDKCSSVIPPSTTYPFTVDFAAGTYTYYCTYHPNAMFGNFVVREFSISSNPSSLTVAQGASGSSTLTVTSLSTFSGPVSLSANSPNGITATPNPPSVTVSPGGSAMSTLTVTAGTAVAGGVYTVTVTGMSASTTETTTVTVTVIAPDFTIAANPSSLTTIQGSSGTSTITITSIDGFSGTVALSAAVSPAGPSASITPGSLALSSGGTGTATLTVSTFTGAYSSTATGSYTVTITGTSGSLSHPATVSVTVNSSNSSPLGAGNIPVSVLIGVIAAAVAVIVVAIILVRRRPKT